MRIIIKQINGISTPVCEETGELVEGITDWTLDVTPGRGKNEPSHGHLTLETAMRLPVVVEPEPKDPCPFCGAAPLHVGGESLMWKCATFWRIHGGDESRRDYAQSPYCLGQQQKEEGHAKE